MRTFTFSSVALVAFAVTAYAAPAQLDNRNDMMKRNPLPTGVPAAMMERLRRAAADDEDDDEDDEEDDSEDVA
jgi:hypothetical protein